MMDNTEKSARRRAKAAEERNEVRINAALRDEEDAALKDLIAAHGQTGALRHLVRLSMKRRKPTNDELLAELAARLKPE